MIRLLLVLGWIGLALIAASPILLVMLFMDRRDIIAALVFIIGGAVFTALYRSSTRPAQVPPPSPSSPSHPAR